MIFDRYVNVPVDRIAQAASEIVAECTDERKEQFLQSWDPWKQFQRAICVVPSYEELPTISKPLEIDDVCAITQEAPKQPVYYNNTLYEYEQFITQYRKTGKDPMNQDPATNEIKLDRLKRVKNN